MDTRHLYDVHVTFSIDDDNNLPYGWWEMFFEHAQAAMKRVLTVDDVAGSVSAPGWFRVAGTIDVPEKKVKRELVQLGKSTIPKYLQAKLADPLLTDLEIDISEADAMGADLEIEVHVAMVSVTDTVTYNL
jgi:hypothetical protein